MRNKENAHYLVTGGCGFIGTHLVRVLIEQGYQVTILDNLSSSKRESAHPQATLIIGSITDAATVQKAAKGKNGVFHLAAIASVQKCNEEWVKSHEVNLTGSIRVFQAATENGVPVVYASSAAVYGANDELPLKEAATTIPLSAYGADKLGCELHARTGYKVHGLSSMGLRFFNVYGPGQPADSPYSGVISIFIDRIRNGQSIRIDGNGTQTRDLVHVGDVCGHLVAAMESLHAQPACEVLNVCTGKATTITALATLIEKLSGRSAPRVQAPRRVGDIPGSIGDPTCAQKMLSISADTKLEAGLEQFIGAFQSAQQQ